MASPVKTYLIIAMAALVAGATSCISESLQPCPDDKVVITIVNDWKESPAADPEGMAYMFYRKGVASPWRFDFPGRDAGKVALEPGEYEFVMFNDDTYDVVFEAGRGGLPFVTTSPDMARRDAGRRELYEAPDMMWSGSIAMIKVSHDGVEYASGDTLAGHPGRYQIVTHPRQITPVYTVRVLRVVNIRGVSAMKGTISGMSYGIDLYGIVGSDRSVDVAFNPVVAADSTVEARFHTFGVSASHDATNELRLCFLLSDGRLICQTYDVTKDVKSAPDPMNVEIVIDSLSLPCAPPVIEGGAFAPTVADWTTVIVNYGT